MTIDTHKTRSKIRMSSMGELTQCLVRLQQIKVDHLEGLVYRLSQMTFTEEDKQHILPIIAKFEGKDISRKPVEFTMEDHNWNA